MIIDFQYFQDKKKHVSAVVSLFLLSQVFLILSHGPLVHTLAAIILKSDLDIIENGAGKLLEEYSIVSKVESVAFAQPKENLETSLDRLNETQNEEVAAGIGSELVGIDATNKTSETESTENAAFSEPIASSSESKIAVRPDALDIGNPGESLNQIKNLNVTDEEKEQRLALESPLTSQQTFAEMQESLGNKPFLEAILNSLSCTENDYAALFSLCLLYALANNQVL